MTGVLTGFSVILTVILAGYLAARTGVVQGHNRLVLNRVAFYVASPALLYGIVSQSDLRIMVSPVVLVSGVVCVLLATAYALVSRVWFRTDFTTTTLAAASTGYMNLNNMGLPVGMYVIGEISVIPPLIVMQVVVFAPIVLAILEFSRGSHRGIGVALGRAFRNPIVIGVALGVLTAMTRWNAPEFITAPLEMLGAAAIPLVLLSFGASFYGERFLQRGSGLRMVAVVSVMKSFIAPLLAWVIAGPILGLDPHTVYAVTVVMALPTAQNMYNYAANYRRSELLVRNIVFVTTFASLPVILVVALLLAP